jgi:acetylornithine/LysW-gamma-L-lysine aminotransferase
MSYADIEREFTFEVYPKRDLTLVRGEGATVWDDAGRSYIDCTSGVGVANVGHGNPQVAQAIAKQAATLTTCAGIFYNDVRARLLEKLVGIAPDGLNRAFLCNSGAETMEAAIKFARHATGKSEFVCAMRGFHGRTMGALSATFKYRDQYEPLLGGFSFVPFNNIEKLRDALGESTAAVILEPVQGEGGVRPADPDYMVAVQALCKEKGVLLVVDEIQTGLCRTGAMFASDQYGITPDILCLAKALGGGVPIGAVLTGDRITPAVGMHGSTFGGNPVACAAALATIEFMEENDLCGHARKTGDWFAEQFRSNQPARVRELRQAGLMIGIELKEKATPFLIALMKEGVLALSAGPTVIRLLPPLVISRDELGVVIEKLVKVLAD